MIGGFDNMKKFKIDDREFVITDEMEAMGEKVEKILEETFPIGFSYPRLGEISDSLLEEFGNWIYEHMHDYEKASKLIYMMLYSCFNEHERNVVWRAFDENVNIDFDEVMNYLLEVLDENLEEYPTTCQEIVYNFVKDESQSLDSLNYKYCVQMHLCENVKWIAEDIVNGKRQAPDNIIQGCKKLLEYTDDYGICGRYIGYLMSRNEFFLDILTTIRENY